MELRAGILVELTGLSNPLYNKKRGVLTKRVPSGRWNVAIGKGMEQVRAFVRCLTPPPSADGRRPTAAPDPFLVLITSGAALR